MLTAISPCPNDTYLFYPWISYQIKSSLPIEPVYADIQTLNEWAPLGKHPLTKLSFPTFQKVSHLYQLLPIGTALGYHCGPKIIAKRAFPIENIGEKKIAIPGKDTTAHLLLNSLLTSPKEKKYCFYHEIMDLIEREEVDCGLIIHESRFTYQNRGFVEIVDLGELWHTKKQLPLPLGGLALLRTLPETQKRTILQNLQKSMHFSDNHRVSLIDYLLQYAQEKDPEVVFKHIDLYVTDETRNLTAEGIRAIESLIGTPREHDWLFTGT